MLPKQCAVWGHEYGLIPTTSALRCARSARWTADTPVYVVPCTSCAQPGDHSAAAVLLIQTVNTPGRHGCEMDKWLYKHTKTEQNHIKSALKSLFFRLDVRDESQSKIPYVKKCKKMTTAKAQKHKIAHVTKAMRCLGA